jgi:hypothetical protein
VQLFVFLAWFALLFTGEYPRGMYKFVANYTRFSGRALAFTNLMTDEYPSFGGDDDPSYPVRVHVAPPLPKYGRWRVFLRGPIALLGLMIMYIGYGLLIVFLVVASAPIAHWLVIVNDGRARLSLHRLTWVYVAFSTRINAWFFLMAQDFPPFLSEWERSAAVGAGPAAVAP